jgi:hypothetical protein
MATVQIIIEIQTDDPTAAIQRAYDEIPSGLNIVGQTVDGDAVDEEGDRLW